MKLAISFTNLGPYHLARLRALASRLADRGDELIAYETAGSERRYPWLRSEAKEAFKRVTLFPDRHLEGLSRLSCLRAISEVLDRDRPDALGIAGYARPESVGMLRWARRRRVPIVLMSESQEIDHPRVWWKETIKRRRVRKFSAALVGGPSHADYLIRLGFPSTRIAYGYNAVDNERFIQLAGAARSSSDGREGLPERPYFIAVSRFVPEKNLPRLIGAFVHYRGAVGEKAWDLALCGSGEGESKIDEVVRSSGLEAVIHRPGFLQGEALARWLTHASAFVHPSLMEPWGLVVNEAAACELPLLISDRSGCVATLVPDPPGTTGRRFDPASVLDIADALAWVTALPEVERRAMGRRAASVISEWGPDRFARGMIESLRFALDRKCRQAPATATRKAAG